VPAGVQEHHFLFIIEMGEFKWNIGYSQ
jgi:hypothetical protein